MHRVGEVTIDYAKDAPAVESSSKEAGKVFDSLWASCEYKLRARHAEASQAVRRFAKRPTAVPTRTARRREACAVRGTVARWPPPTSTVAAWSVAQEQVIRGAMRITCTGSWCPVRSAPHTSGW